MRCESVSDLLAEVADGTPLADRSARRHVESCLRCQADLAQYRKLLRALHNLRVDVLEPAPGMLSDLIASLEEAGERHALRGMLQGRKLAYTGGIAAATAAGAAGVVLFAARGRRLRHAS